MTTPATPPPDEPGHADPGGISGRVVSPQQPVSGSPAWFAEEWGVDIAALPPGLDCDTDRLIDENLWRAALLLWEQASAAAGDGSPAEPAQIDQSAAAQARQLMAAACGAWDASGRDASAGTGTGHPATLLTYVRLQVISTRALTGAPLCPELEAFTDQQSGGTPG